MIIDSEQLLLLNRLLNILFLVGILSLKIYQSISFYIRKIIR